jgi:tetratricopeptide (TPR) repeat protein
VREPVFSVQLENLRQQLMADAGTNFYTRWAKWFFADRATRTLSPSSSITVPEYVRRRIDEGTPGSLREAVSLAPTNTEARSRLELANLLAQIESLNQTGRTVESLALAEEGLLTHANSVELWCAKGRILDATSRWKEAEQACSRALNLAGTNQLLLTPSPTAPGQGSIWANRRVADSRAAFLKLLELACPTALSCRDAAFQGDYRALLEGQRRHVLEEIWDLDRLRMLAERAVRLDPADWKNFQLLGMAQYRDEQFAAAVERFQTEARLRGGNLSARSRLFMAMTHQQLHETEKARDCFEKARRWWETSFNRLPPSHQADFVALKVEAERLLWPDRDKTGWKVVSASYEAAGGGAGEASRAIDGDRTTLWSTWEGDDGRAPPQEIVVDLGQRLDLTAFRYQPRPQGLRGLTDEYELSLSTDGNDWKKPTRRGMFANFREYPVQQTVLFEEPVTARFLRFVGLHAVEGDYITVAELGVVGDSRQSDQIWNLIAQGKSLTKSDRLDDALEVLAQAVELASADTNAFEQPLAEARLNRAAVLRRLNRLTEAGLDNCLAQGIPLRDPQARSELVDLSPFYDGALTREMQNLEMRPGLRNDLSTVPQGVHHFGPIEFDVRGLINLSGTFLSRSLMARFPSAVTIPLQRKAARIHFFHGTVWLVPRGTVVGRYVLRFVDGQEHAYPIVYGIDVRDWHRFPGQEQEEGLVVAWEGYNQASKLNGGVVQLTRSTIENPRPGVAVANLDFVSALTDSAPFLIAVTVE